MTTLRPAGSRHGWPQPPRAVPAADELGGRDGDRTQWPPGRIVAVDGVQVHVVDEGPRDGTPLVLLHGMGVMGEEFRLGELPGLAVAHGYRVLIPDRPGYGWSTRPAEGEPWSPEQQARVIRGLLARCCGDTPAIVLGHSWGSLVAVALALEAPTAVRALVLESGYAFSPPRLELALLAPLSLPVIGPLWRRTLAPWLMRALWPWSARRLYAPAPVPSSFARRFPLAIALRPSQLHALGADAHQLVAAASRLEARHRELAMPVAIVAGTGDRIVDPLRHEARLAREVAGERLVWVHGAGHMVHTTAPRIVLDTIEALAADTGSAGPCAAAR